MTSSNNFGLPLVTNSKYLGIRLLLTTLYPSNMAWTKNYPELLESFQKSNHFSIHQLCLSYAMQFFILIFNMDYWHGHSHLNYIITKLLGLYCKIKQFGGENGTIELLHSMPN